MSDGPALLACLVPACLRADCYVVCFSAPSALPFDRMHACSDLARWACNLPTWLGVGRGARAFSIQKPGNSHNHNFHV